ncbi:MAG TPA: hypothetical protein DCW68_06920 [Rhodospirillaceae bacterium]|nr:hypothetical protein [Rhodospirillaceae bacterium]
MMCGGLQPQGRQADDFYPTPADVTRALIAEERVALAAQPAIWEPACGSGAISKVMEHEGFRVISSDLRDYGYGTTADFLKTQEAPCTAIVTNPPFRIAEDFILHARRLGVSYLALLLKSQFWNAKSRLSLFNEWRPHTIYPLTWRPDFLDRGAPTMDVMWVVWRGDIPNWNTVFKPIGRPKNAGMVNERRES